MGRVNEPLKPNRFSVGYLTSKALLDTDGHVLIKGDKVRIRFTVKGHDTYNDVPQTVIFRVNGISKATFHESA